jgi:hypothetical protein
MTSPSGNCYIADFSTRIAAECQPRPRSNGKYGFKQAGFPYSDDHISRLCKLGVLRATQQTTKNKLKRYVIDPRSIDEQIERLRREKEGFCQRSRQQVSLC